MEKGRSEGIINLFSNSLEHMGYFTGNPNKRFGVYAQYPT